MLLAMDMYALSDGSRKGGSRKTTIIDNKRDE